MSWEVFTPGTKPPTNTLAATFALPQTSEASTNPEKWDEQWENIMKFLTPEIVFQQNKWNNDNLFNGNAQHQIFENVGLVERTRGMRTDIGVLFSKVSPHFYPRWLSASPSQRRKHVFRAVSEACAIARNMNFARSYCLEDELSLTRLSNDPKAIPELFAKISQSNTEIYYVPSAKWDRLGKVTRNQSEMDRATFDNIRILRTLLIYQVVQYTVYSFLGLELPKVYVKKSRQPHNAPNVSADEEFAKQLSQMGLKSEAERIMAYAKSEQSDIKGRKSQRVQVCSRPGCFKTEGVDERFKRCGRCGDKQDRHVHYCSKSCQVDDWKRHKQICGKALTADDAERIGSSRGDD